MLQPNYSQASIREFDGYENQSSISHLGQKKSKSIAAINRNSSHKSLQKGRGSQEYLGYGGYPGMQESGSTVSQYQIDRAKQQDEYNKYNQKQVSIESNL